MKIVIPGGSGHVGTILARDFHGDGHEVLVLSRSPRPAPWRTTPWDGRTLGAWARELDGADVLINLAGRSVNCRYDARNRAQILDSRVESTRIIGRAIAAAQVPPRVWLQASTATIYAHRYDAANDEAGGIIGGKEPGAPETWRFSIDVATAWERALDEAETPRTRKLKLRSAIVMAPDPGGPFHTLLALVRLGLGGRAGDGRQFVSWVHDQDFVEAVRFLIAREDLEGAVNIAAPNPLPNAEFMLELRKAWGRSFGLPASGWMLELGAIFLRTETELILKSRRVIPGRLLAGGFRFRYPDWLEAAKELCDRCRLTSRRSSRAPGRHCFA